MLADELWLVHGTDPVAWTIPAYVSYRNEAEALIESAVPLMSAQRLAFERALEPVAKREKTWWRLPKSALPRLADKAKQGSDPEALFVWERARNRTRPAYAIGDTVDRDSFLGSFYLSNRVSKTSLAEVEFWWRQFCEHMLFWLLNKEKPLDLYFAKLHCVPYRANWKTILLGRFPNLGPLLCRGSETQRKEHALVSGFEQELTCLDLLAMDPKEGYLHRRLDLEHTPIWWKNVLRVEMKRLKELGSTRYARQFLASVRRGLDRARALYVGWLTSLKLPSAQDVECGPPGDFRLVPNLSQSLGTRCRPRKSVMLPVVVPDTAPEYLPASDPETLYQADEQLSLLRTLQQMAKNLRNPWGKFYSPTNVEEGEIWLPLLSPREELASLELLAVANHYGAKGVARPVEPAMDRPA